MKKFIIRFNFIFLLVVAAIWLFAPQISPKTSNVCDVVSSRILVGAYNTFSNKVNAQVEGGVKAAITFDDGFECVYTNVYPILNEYDYTAAIAVIGSRIGKHKYLSYKQLSILYRNDYEIINHSYNHIESSTLSDEQIFNEYRVNGLLLNACGFLSGSDIIVTPCGIFRNDYFEIAKNADCKAIRTLKRLYLVENKKRTQVKIINIYGSRTIEDIKLTINESIEESQNIIFVFHKVIDNPPQHDMFISTKKFIEIMDYIDECEIDVVSYSTLIQEEIEKEN